jgi:hypothetical protein
MRGLKLKDSLSNAVYLEQEAYEAEGVKFFGTKFFWNCPDGNPYYDQIPTDTDVLITHTPPKGILDTDRGCPAIRKKVGELKPKLHVFGHIHSGYGNTRGTDEYAQTIFVNASIAGEDHRLAHEPIVVDIE